MSVRPAIEFEGFGELAVGPEIRSVVAPRHQRVRVLLPEQGSLLLRVHALRIRDVSGWPR